MKRKTTRKLILPRDIVRDLQAPELEAVAGGVSVNAACGSCGNPRSTCPPA